MATKLPDRPNPRSFSDQELNVIRHHRRELSRGGVRNKDGSISTFIGSENPILGAETVYPKLRNGKILSDEDARSAAEADQVVSRGKYWPTYESSDKAQQREKIMHLQMEEDLINAEKKSNGGIVRGDGASRVRTKGRMC